MNQHSEPTFSTYGAHRHWWTVLPALPPSQEAVDWWETEDGRASRYRRLRRVWFDYTWFQRPKEDPERPHAFSNPRHGTHASIALWENFVLWHPRDFVPALVRAIGLSEPAAITDACWSYEYQEPISRKTADIVLHARDEHGEDMALVVEAKYGKTDRLKENPKAGLPDTNPAAYRDLPPLMDIPRREAVYLVQPSYVPTVRKKVGPDTPGYGVLTWPELVRVQLDLCDVLPPASAGLVRATLLSIAAKLGAVPADSDVADTPAVAELRSAARATKTPEHVRNWLAGAAFYVGAAQGTVPPDVPFDYLASELSFPEIHRLPPDRRQKEPHSTEYWRLPR